MKRLKNVEVELEIIKHNVRPQVQDINMEVGFIRQETFLCTVQYIVKYQGHDNCKSLENIPLVSEFLCPLWFLKSR